MSREAYDAYRRSEEYRAKDRAEYAANPAIREANRAQCRDYYRRKKEEIAARMREYNQRPEVRERNRQKNREWYERKGKANGVIKVKEVTLSYARERIVSSSKGLIGKDIPVELLEAKQAEIKLKRLVDEMLPPEAKKAIQKVKGAPKRKLSSREYYRANREKCLEYAKQWRAKNRDRVRAREKVLREANREKLAAQARVRYHNNLEKERAKLKAYREKNREVLKAKAKEKYHANKEEINAERRNISPEKRAHINALARAAVARRKLKNKLNQEGVAQ